MRALNDLEEAIGTLRSVSSCEDRIIIRFDWGQVYVEPRHDGLNSTVGRLNHWIGRTIGILRIGENRIKVRQA
jgi:ABC-type phosphonate transport system ATPase subunit